MTQRLSLLMFLACVTLGFLASALYTLFKDQIRPSQIPTVTLPIGTTPQALRLTVLESGIAVVPLQTVREANLAVENFSADTLSLTRQGQPIGFYIDEDSPDGNLYFYAQAITNALAEPAVYWLEPGPGLAMAQRPAQPTRPGETVGKLRQRWEENISFQPRTNGSDAWLGMSLFAPVAQSFSLQGITPAVGPAELNIRFWSSNESPVDPDHHVQLLLNGELLGDYYWDGIREETIAVPLRHDQLTQTSNELTIAVPGDTGAAGEALYLNWVELDYTGQLVLDHAQLHFQSSADHLSVMNASDKALIFDVTNPTEPQRLVGATTASNVLNFLGGGLDGNGLGGEYIVLEPARALKPVVSVAPERSPLRQAAGADYIAIVPDGDGVDNPFLAALQPLVDYRSRQGLQVMTVSLSQIYDEFAFGQATPEAIRDFLAFAVTHWRPAPRFALLVGDASYDIRQFTGGRNHNYIPTYLVYTQYAGYVASDTYFAVFDEGSLAPGIAIGRLPVQLPSQVSAIVKKTLEYEQPQQTGWQDRALLVADDENIFNQVSDELAANLESETFRVDKLYMTQNEDIHDSLISILNQGVGILNYVGHGSVRVWGDERVFEAEDAVDLNNGAQVPIFTTFTCLNGYFNHPEEDALAETLLWASQGGIVAAVAPSGRSTTTQQLPLADAFFKALLTGQATTLGEALQQAKIASASNLDLAEVIHTFNLLGDPALHFHLPARALGANP